MSIDVPTGAPTTAGSVATQRQDPSARTPAPPATARVRWRPGDQVIVNVFVVLLVLTQRIGIPMLGTSISVSLPLGYLLLVVLALRGALGISRIRVELLLVAAAACLAATAAVSLAGKDFSTPSLLLLLAIYVPWVFRSHVRDGFELVRSAGRTLVTVMLVLAPIGVLQFTSQLLGVWSYEDYLENSLPPDFIVPSYNYANPLEYGSSTFKATAFVLLEPSFLSQLCGLAVLIGLMLRVPAWQLVLLGAGMAASVSGTGILLLAAGAALLLLRAPRLLRVGYVVAAAVAGVLVWFSPVANLLLNRTGEFTQTRTSGYSRFVAPYTEVFNGLRQDPIRYAFGDGPGNSENLLVTTADGALLDANFSILPKLAFEYGLVAGGLFVIFLVVSMLRGAPWRVVPGSLLFMTFFLSGALLQPQTAFLAWVFTTLGSREDAAAPPEPGTTPAAGIDDR